MRWKESLFVAFVVATVGMASPPASAQGVGKYIAPQDQVVVIRAGHLFDARAGKMLDNQLISIKGDRISASRTQTHKSPPARA